MLELLRKRLAGKKGFTLIELIVVIAVIAILAVILIPRFTGFTQSAREKSAMSDARNILMAVEALIAEGKTATEITTTEINTYLGKDVIVNGDTLNITSGDVDFTFVKKIGDKTYTATCADSVITSVTVS